MKITIEIDDADVAAVLSRLGLTVHPPSTPSRPAVRPFAEGLDEPGDVNQADLDPTPSRPPRPGGDAPTTGRELLGWISGHGGKDVQHRAVAIARGRGYGTMLVQLNPDQVADVYHELACKPRRGHQKWGG